jgi:hypothetical protein
VWIIVFDCARLLISDLLDLLMSWPWRICNNVPHQLKCAVIKQNRQAYTCRGYPLAPRYKKEQQRTYIEVETERRRAKCLFEGQKEVGLVHSGTTIGGIE